MPRPPSPLLNRELIARTALELCDEEGEQSLTMRRLATRLGVAAPSLYNHVANSGEIVDLIHELIESEVDTSGLDDEDWRAGFAAFMRSHRAAFVRHPTATALIARRPIGTSKALATYEALAAWLTRHGLDPATGLKVTAVIDYLTLGSALGTFIGAFDPELSGYREPYPALTAALGAADWRSIDANGFELGLEMLTAWLAARIER